MQLPQRDDPQWAEPARRPGPQPVPEPAAKPKSKRKWLGALLAAVIAGGLYMAFSSGQQPPGGSSMVLEIPTATLEERPLETVVRLTGTTQAERYASVVVPRLRGSRRGRGRSARSNLIQANANISVRTTSTVSMSSTSSSLSKTGLVSSTGNTAGGGFSGGARSGSAALQASTTRVGGSSRGGGSTGNVSTVQVAAAGAMGTSGLGSTSSNLSGGSSGPPAIGGGGRRRGDFTMALQKLTPAGSSVKKGDIIAEFDQQYMLQRLDDYKDSVTQTEASYRKGKADLAVTRDAHNQSIKAALGTLDKAKLDIKATPVLSAID